MDDYFPAQAQFFLGEIYRLHYEGVKLDPDEKGGRAVTDLEYKAELLLSAQGHYLRAIRIGNGYWATAAGARIGGLYENLHDQMIHSPAPKELNAEEARGLPAGAAREDPRAADQGDQHLRATLEAAERIGTADRSWTGRERACSG